MTLARANPIGWALFELLTSAQMNTLDSQLPFALDGKAGGLYSPTGMLTVDGVNVAANPTLRLRNAPAQPALHLDVVNGSGGMGMRIEGAQDAPQIEVNANAGSMAKGSAPAPVVRLKGLANTTNDGGIGLQATGGECASSGTASIAGTGVYAVGGPRNGLNIQGGIGVRAVAGSADFTGNAFVKRASSGVHTAGAPTVGGSASHRAGNGVESYGGAMTVNGFGGSGVYGEGGLGPNGVTLVEDFYYDDGGHGVIGRGSSGVLGVSRDVNPYSLPSEFQTGNVTSALRAIATGSNMGLLSEHSGASLYPELNLIKRKGSTHSAVQYRTILAVENAISGTVPSGAYYTTGLQVSSTSSSGNFRAILAAGRGKPALELNTQANAAVEYGVHLKLNRQYKPSNADFVNGGIFHGYAAMMGVSGLLADSLFIGSRGIYDRVITSGDLAAPVAWARLLTYGDGSAVLGAHYGCSGASVVTVSSQGVLEVELDTIVGQHTYLNMAVFLTMSSNHAQHEWPTYQVFDATHIRIFVHRHDGTPVDLSSEARQISIVIYASPTIDVPADRPTYFAP